MPLKNTGKKIQSVKIGQKKVLIKFDDDTKLEIFPNTFTEFNLFKGKILSNKEIKEIKERNNIELYYEKALKLLSSRSYSENKIKEKLASYGASEQEIELVIKELHKYDLLNDQEVIDEVLEVANYNNYGYNRIKDELYKKGVKKYLIDNIPYVESDEIRKANNSLIKLEKKYSKENNASKKRKIYTSLVRLGFESSVINQVIDNVKENDIEVELALLRVDFDKAYKRYKGKYIGNELTDKVINYLLAKGYRYNDINKIKGEYINEMD